jgi:hypothetical protein
MVERSFFRDDSFPARDFVGVVVCICKMREVFEVVDIDKYVGDVRFEVGNLVLFTK